MDMKDGKNSQLISTVVTDMTQIKMRITDLHGYGIAAENPLFRDESRTSSCRKKEIMKQVLHLRQRQKQLHYENAVIAV